MTTKTVFKFNISLLHKGLLSSLIKILGQTLNFTTTRPRPPDGNWGASFFNAASNATEWNGIIRMLMEGEADICSSGLSVILERAQVKPDKQV